MAENFPKLMTDTKPQIQEPQRPPFRINNKNVYTKVYHIKTAENQRDNLERNQRKKTHLTDSETKIGI